MQVENEAGTATRRHRLGAHMSIAGGCFNALLRGRDVGCDAVQLFTKNANQWKAKPLAEADAESFRATLQKTGYSPEVLIAHDSYLINLASQDPELWEKSLAAFAEELDRCAFLGIPYLVTHAGAHMGAGEEAGLARITAAIDRVLGERADSPTMVLLETTAGQGTSLCYRFEHIGEVLAKSAYPDRIGVCLDTCHVFVAGYDVSDPAGYESTMDQFDRYVGLDKLKVFHLNDAKKGLGSRVDRHEHIGQGQIGTAAFGFILNDPRVNDRPMVIETQKGEDCAEDRMNLATLRALIE